MVGDVFGWSYAVGGKLEAMKHALKSWNIRHPSTYQAESCCIQYCYTTVHAGQPSGTSSRGDSAYV